jgi:hypothetical protein
MMFVLPNVFFTKNITTQVKDFRAGLAPDDSCQNKQSNGMEMNLT